MPRRSNKSLAGILNERRMKRHRTDEEISNDMVPIDSAEVSLGN